MSVWPSSLLNAAGGSFLGPAQHMVKVSPLISRRNEMIEPASIMPTHYNSCRHTSTVVDRSQKTVQRLYNGVMAKTAVEESRMLGDETVAQLEQLIMTGRLKPGQKLLETALSKRFGT